ncbi:uncharacterized protein BDW43DRAFT_304288 [Aspergillus alliaceus]|uniref:uncharacterized protein n=1 Tax=Petromyces alliaceus TaxID=209559 RepID=UPI0012A506B9|nr:uncharacterized protein BDW43DRAFT_304288 [Aspergillus alliaceus]KAB8227898.1 hypothetical protein BDW43DRAFT_304288 [Aspergillus alliaceus]
MELERIVEFVIGKDRRRFQIHAALAGLFPKEILQPPLNHEIDEIIVHEGVEVPNTDPAVSYADVFLSHAQVYRLGHRTDWVSLCALSLYRLTRSLASFTLFEERTGDIIRLLSFVFEESEDMKNMQDMLLDYAAWNIEILLWDADFPQLLERIPLLENTIFRSMWR